MRVRAHETDFGYVDHRNVDLKDAVRWFIVRAACVNSHSAQIWNAAKKAMTIPSGLTFRPCLPLDPLAGDKD